MRMSYDLRDSAVDGAKIDTGRDEVINQDGVMDL